MNHTFQSRPASRGSVKPLIGLFSESGCGKSMSALLIARGLVGLQGNIQQIDSESGRGELYSDVIPGGYNTIPMIEPFSPDRYIEAVRFAEEQKADVIVIDQISSEWDGIGSVLDLATQNEESGKKGLSVWKAPKMAHAKMMVRLLQSRCPIIVCLRAKHKSRQVKNNARTEIIKDEFTTPIQADDFVFEMTAHGEVLADHSFRLTKCSHPELRKCFPTQGPITIQHGEMIARWCAAPSGSVNGINGDPLKALQTEIWKLSRPVRGDDKTWSSFEHWAIDKAILGDTETVKEMSEDRLKGLLEDLKKVL